jgi:HK97 family phage prohead protease
VPDLSGDVILKGAFARNLIPAARGRVRMLHQHATEEPVGVWTEMREDGRGLFVRGHLFTDTGLGRDLSALLTGGALDGLSIGFKPVAWTRTRTGRELREVDLWEVSIVTFPMAPRARITRVRPLSDEEVGRPPRNLLS